MEPKYLHRLSCISLLFLLNPFLFMTPSQADSQSLDYLLNLVGTRKGNSAKGLSQLKKYLSHLGYMTNTTPENDDHFDDKLELAIKGYQRFFKLTVNGMLDAKTVAKLKQPRCGVPDNNSKLKDVISIIDSHYTFFEGQPKWPKRNLTYSFLPNMQTTLNRPILHAALLWAHVSPFEFYYIPDYNKADIKISFQSRDHGDGNPFDGSGGILAHAFAPTDGRLHYDQDERWVDGVTKGAFDLQTVGLHELGHILGLMHTSDEGAIMYPCINNGVRKVLGQDDINGITELYPS